MKGENLLNLDITKIKHKQKREIALIRRYTQPKVNTENEKFQSIIHDGSHKINRFV